MLDGTPKLAVAIDDRGVLSLGRSRQWRLREDLQYQQLRNRLEAVVEDLKKPLGQLTKDIEVAERAQIQHEKSYMIKRTRLDALGQDAAARKGAAAIEEQVATAHAKLQEARDASRFLLAQSLEPLHQCNILQDRISDLSRLAHARPFSQVSFWLLPSPINATVGVLLPLRWARAGLLFHAMANP